MVVVSVIVECKKCHRDRIKRRKIKPHEKMHVVIPKDSKTNKKTRAEKEPGSVMVVGGGGVNKLGEPDTVGDGDGDGDGNGNGDGDARGLVVADTRGRVWDLVMDFDGEGNLVPLLVVDRVDDVGGVGDGVGRVSRATIFIPGSGAVSPWVSTMSTLGTTTMSAPKKEAWMRIVHVKLHVLVVVFVVAAIMAFGSFT